MLTQIMVAFRHSILRDLCALLFLNGLNRRTQRPQRETEWLEAAVYPCHV